MTTIVYTKNDFEKVEYSNFDDMKYISSDTLSMINDLTDQVSAPTYSKTPSFPLSTPQSSSQSKESNGSNISSTSGGSYSSKYRTNTACTSADGSHLPYKSKSGHYTKSSHFKKSSCTSSTASSDSQSKSDEKWRGTKTSFQVTKIKRNKEGDKGIVDEIRLLLNKLTDKTYKKISEQIENIISEIVSSELKNEIIQQIINFACINNINGKSYADLLSQLDNSLGVSEGDCIKTLMTTYSDSFSELLGKSTSPEEDYDTFCEMNVKNNKRKGTLQFICFLSESSMVDHNIIGSVFEDLTSLLLKNMDDQSATSYNEEVAENIYIITKNSLSNMKGQKISNVQSLILSHDFSVYTARKYQGITQKAKFKIMDIKDMIKKIK